MAPIGGFERAKALAIRLWPQGLGVFVVCALWSIVFIIAGVATAQSAKPWDTLIAALAMISQAFFAFLVWRLTRQQFEFNQRTVDKQHKIDMFPLRHRAVQVFEKLVRNLSYGMTVGNEEVEKFRLSHLEIEKLFSPKAEEMAYNVYQLVEEAALYFDKAVVEYEPIRGRVIHKNPEIEALAAKISDNALGVAIDLQNLLDDEMSIR